MPLATYEILGVNLHLVLPEANLEGYRTWIEARLAAGQGAQVVTCNPEMIMLAHQNPTFAQVLQMAELVIPDGTGVVWALRRQRIPVRRVPGIELAESLIQTSAQRGWRLALVGGKPDVNQAALQRWQAQCPQLSLWGYHGYFSPQQEVELLQALQEFQPQVVLVGLGSPRQELWIQARRGLSPGAIWIGVGGSFDIWAGKKERAPRWWRDHHLEWLYRLYQEPWRWRRMLALPRFVWRVLRDPSSRKGLGS
ncbi:WecB/TagA/CpsF family glycosyltransferase [Synechococcus sp. Nb3U1]|uniref:WecB/TagA/CpsF family glycosyltransferase n=1 Tax=Synechococcus sp. Nb3U1 TaxID=1914529 RepID=UPI001F1BC662|nr:WecB/TagA/CpsF family glycosyltransferase [Synechococcus sp. Nb3U1]